MSETNVKICLDRIHNKHESYTVRKAKDWFIQGIQLNRCYMPQWNEIKSIFKIRGIDLNKYGPILTMNEWKDVKYVDKIANNGEEDFISKLHSFPIYARKIADKEFKEWISKNIDKIKSFEGTIMEIDKQIEELIK